MAANDTLKFSVQIVEDDKKNVESLIKKVQSMLDKDFKLKVSDDGTVKKLEELLSVLKSVETQMGVISKGLSNSSWGKLSEDLNIAIAEFRKLTLSAEEFGRTMSKGFASNLKAELDSLLPKLSETAKTLNKVKEESRKSDGSGGIITDVANIEKARAEATRYWSLIVKIHDQERDLGSNNLDVSRLTQYRKQITAIHAELEKMAGSKDGLSSAGLNASEYLRSVGASDMFKNFKEHLKDLQAANAVIEKMSKLANEIQQKLDSVSAANPFRAKLAEAKGDLDLWQGLIARNPYDITKDSDVRNQKMREYEQLLTSATQKEQQMARSATETAKSRNDAAKELDNIERKIKEVSELTSKMKSLRLDTTNIEKAYAELEKLQHSYQLIAAGNGNYTTFKGNAETVASERDIKESVDNAKKAIQDEERKLKENERAKDAAGKSAGKLSAEEQKLSNAMRATTQSASQQSNVLNDLKSMAMQYLSVWGASSFVQSMAQITGELELQQKSLEVIIGSASYASQLFGEIRDLSQQSPYTFQDLLKSTRQLAAFGIETKDLYGTMKALSDIGAGLSVDVQRLILAYGHTKSYGYLSGIQNRQFETAGIDLVGALADRYNKLADAEERAGRAAEHVTRKDVFKMISKKEVGFEDVNAVIMGLDAPGGRFYNMQERQFETLGGKLRNLRNNYNIMMAEMGKANHGMLMSGVNMLNELTEHWDKYARTITAILIPIGALKLANMALNTSIGLQTNAMSKNVMEMVRSEKAMAAMNAAAVKKGFFSPLAAIGAGWNSQGTFTPGRKDAKSFANVLNKGLSDGSLTETNVMYMGLSGDLPERYRRIALALAGVRGEQVKTMASANGLSRVWLKLKMSAASLGASLRGLFAATLGNPMAWVMAVAAGITYLIERWRSLSSAVEEAREKYGQQANDDVKNLDEIMNRYDNFYSADKGIEKNNGGRTAIRRIINVDEAKLEGENVKNILDELKQELQAHSPLYDAEIFDIEAISNEAGRVEKILQNLESHRYAKEVYSMIPEQIASSNKETGGFLNDTFAENAKDYQKAMREFTRTISNISETEYQAILPEQRRQIEAYQKELNLTRTEAIKKYLQDGGKLRKKEAQYITQNGDGLYGKQVLVGYEEVEIGGLESAYKKTRSAWKEVIDDSKKMVDEYANIFKEYFQDDPIAAEDFFLTSLRDLLSDNKVADPDVQKKIGEYLITQIQGALNGIDVSEDFKKSMEGMVFMANVKAEYQRSMDNANLSWASSRGEIGETSYNAWQGAFRKMIESSTDDGVKAKYRQLAHEHMAEYVKGAEQFWRKWHPDEAWKNRLMYSKNDKGNQTTSEFSAYFQKAVNEANDYYTFWFDTMKKSHDEMAKNLNNIFEPLRKKWKIDIDTDITFSTKDLDKLRKVRDSIKQQVDDAPFFKKKEAEEELAPALKEISKMIVLLEAAEKEGIDFEDDKKKNRGGRGTYKDTEYEVWEQRVKIIQEARREYEYWEKAVGKESAQDKVKKQFESLVGVDKVLKPGDLDNLEKYGEVLKAINAEVEERYQKDKGQKGKNAEIRLANDVKLLREIAKTLNDISKMEFEKATEEFVSGMSRALDDLSQRWEIFDSIREKNGNDAVSMRMAGFTATDSGATFKRDAMKQSIQDYMTKAAPSVGALDFGKLFGMDEKSLKTEIDDMFRVYTKELYKTIADTESSAEEVDNAKSKLVEYETRIKAVVEALKEWQKAEKDTDKAAIMAYAEVLGKAVDYESEVGRIDAAAKKQKDLIKEAQKDRYDKDGNLIGKGLTDSEAAKANGMVDAEAESKKWKISVQYLNLMNGAMAMTRKELSDGINKAMEDLERLWKNNLINARDYATEMEKLHKIQRDYDLNGAVYGNGAFGAFAKGGVNGAVGWYDTAITNRIAELKEAGTYTTDENGKYNGDDERLKKLLGRREMWESAQKGLTGVADVSQLVMGALSGLQGAAEELSKMFDALGNERMANKFSDISDGIGGVMSGLDGISGMMQSAMNGDIGGFVSNALMAPVKLFTGPIAAFSALHDKKRDRHIERIGKEITKISNTLETIRDLREQELGYAAGNNIRALAAQYRTQSAANKATEAMAEYYGRATDGASNSYALEYNLLLDQRKKKMQQYNEEADKKKKDDAKLEEYKKEIAEMDAEIQQFAENLMNDLWGIDFKGWASQISDALMTAFENGTNAADAFDEAVSDILRDMAKNMLQLAIVEPFMDMIKKQVLGYTDENGQYHAGVVNTQDPEEMLNNPQEYGTKVGTAIAEGLSEIKDPLITAMQEGYDGMNDVFKQSGFDLSNKDKSSGSNSISQTITEETAGYMTGILAAMHQDGSVRRLQLQMLVGEQMPNVIEMMTVSGGHIAGIDENTRAIMRMMQNGSGKLYERVYYIGDKLDRFANGFDKVAVR